MKRFTKVAVLAAALLGLVATAAPPAQATTVGVGVFLGSATLGGGLSYPVTTGGPGNVTVPPGQHCALPLPTGGQLPTNCHLNWGGNTRAVTGFASTLCAMAGATVGKAGKAPATAGACNFAAAAGKAPEGNHVHGFCGLSGGQVRATFTSSEPQNYALDVHFNGVASVLVLSGHWTKGGQTGLLVGATLALPIPVLTGTTLGNSCSAGTATSFTLAGAAALLPV